MLLGCMHLSAASFSQHITLKAKKRPLADVLNDVQRQTALRVIYNDHYLSEAQPVTITARGMPLDEFLTRILDGQALTFSIRENTIIVGKPKAAMPPTAQSPTPATTQQRIVSGTVTDESGTPLADVTVTVKNTRTAVTTDAQGTYQLRIPDGESVLVFTIVGFEPSEQTVGSQTTVNIAMKASMSDLDEVIVVGYGTQKKVNLTGAVSTIGSEMLNARPVSNAAQALQGAAPGLNITQSGELGGSLENRPSINVRGIGTIGQGSSGAPLILIDGMEGDINAISPHDIDNISVLKDASASSIYGSRAPFGVILVTTKSGKSGKAVVQANANFRSSSPVLLPEMMDSYTFVNFMNDARLNSAQGVYFTEERIQRIRDYMDGKITTTLVPRPGQENIWGDGYFEGNDNVDWYKAIYRSSAPSQEYSLNASGGTEKVTYYVAGNYLNQIGLMRFGGDKYGRYNTTGRINGTLSDKTSLTYIFRYSREEFERPSYMTNSLNENIGRQGWPVLPLYDNNGHLYDSPTPALSLRDGGRGARQTDRLAQQLKLTVAPIEGWKVMGDVNYSTTDVFYHWDLQQTFNHDVSGQPYPAQRASEVHEEAGRDNYLNANIYTEYGRSYGAHQVKALIGAQTELMNTRGLMAERQGVIVPSLPVLDVTSGNDPNGKPVPPEVAGANHHWSTLGYFGRINYNYDERYLFEGNLRYDGSSRFRQDKRWIYSPSLSVGWNLSSEDFWSPLQRHINMFKIRGSYGELSNQNTENWYPTYVVMPINSSNGNWLVNGSRPNTASAPGLISSTLSWEQVRTWNLGVDFGFWGNRLTATVDYYTRYTDNMIGPAPELPVNLGTDVPRTNNTDLKTSGIELDVAWNDRLANGLGYNVRFMVADSRNKITRYPNPTGKLDTYIAGRMAGEIWGYKTLGIAKTQAEMDAHLATLPNGGQNALGSNWQAGDLMFVDANGDGLINNGANTIGDHGDLVIIGNNSPRYLTSLDLGANFKGIDLRVFFQAVLKRDYFNNGRYFWGAVGSVWDLVGLKQHTDYFRDDPEHPLGLNTDAYYPRPLLSDKNHHAQTGYLQDASYVRLKNLQVGYSLPGQLIQRIGVQRVRVYFSGENIWTMTKMAKMFDPETVDGGWGGNAYPLSKVYSFGLSLTL